MPHRFQGDKLFNSIHVTDLHGLDLNIIPVTISQPGVDSDSARISKEVKIFHSPGRKLMFGCFYSPSERTSNVFTCTCLG